jgi:hypothetical protein
MLAQGRENAKDILGEDSAMAATIDAAIRRKAFDTPLSSSTIEEEPD